MENHAVNFAKCARLGGKYFNDADHVLAHPHRSCDDGANAENPARFTIQADIGLGVITTQYFARTNALPEKPKSTCNLAPRGGASASALAWQAMMLGSELAIAIAAADPRTKARARSAIKSRDA